MAIVLSSLSLNRQQTINWQKNFTFPVEARAANFCQVSCAAWVKF